MVVFSACSADKKEPTTTQESTAVQLDSLQILTQKINQDSTNMRLYFERAEYFYRKDDLNNALRDLGHTMRLGAAPDEVFILLSDTYLELGKLDDAYEVLKNLVIRSSQNATAQLKLAEVYLLYEDYTSADKCLQSAIHFKPDLAKAHFLLGVVNQEFDNMPKAIENFNNAIEYKPDYYDAYLNLGIYYAENNNDLAIDYYNGALNIDPNDVNTHYMLGLYYQQNEDFDRAIDTYQNIIDVDSTYPLSYYNIGYINLVYFADYEQAIIYLSKAIEANPMFHQAYFNRGYAYELQADYENARLDYQQSLNVMPNFENAVQGMNRLDKVMK